MKKDLSIPLLGFTILAICLLLSLVSCRTYYAGYGKGQAKHRKCGQRNMNSRIFGAIPDTIYIVNP